VHACRSETALGCTLWEAGWGSFACFTCFACCVFQYRYILYICEFLHILYLDRTASVLAPDTSHL
jgi:hypothetical protein